MSHEPNLDFLVRSHCHQLQACLGEHAARDGLRVPKETADFDMGQGRPQLDGSIQRRRHVMATRWRVGNSADALAVCLALAQEALVEGVPNTQVSFAH